MPSFPSCCKYFSVTLGVSYNTSFEFFKREAESYPEAQTTKQKARILLVEVEVKVEDGGLFSKNPKTSSDVSLGMQRKRMH